MNRRQIIEELAKIAPPELAEPFDEGKIGLIIEGNPEITTICTALDVTPRVISVALSRGADLLIVHHTPIWYPLTCIRGPDAAIFREILSHNLNVFVMHTNYDHAQEGVNQSLARLLDLTNTRDLSLGCVGDCNIGVDEIASRLKSPIRIWGDFESCSRLAVVGGSGFDLTLISEAKEQGARAFLSAELKHSVARASPLPCLESTHYALEAPSMRDLADRNGWIYIDDPPVISLTR